jgi:hypothetical protein
MKGISGGGRGGLPKRNYALKRRRVKRCAAVVCGGRERAFENGYVVGTHNL